MSDHPKVAAADHDILDVIRRRWSPRAFDPAKEIARTELNRLFEAARWAPSSLNEQPWRFILAERRATPDVFASLVETMAPGNQAWAGAAPVLVLVALRVTLERNEAVNPHAWYDAGQAVALLTLQATSQGISIRQMEGFDHDRARAAVAVPPPFEPAVIMAIGYAGDPESLARDRHREMEKQPRSRRPLTEFVFEGGWGKPLGS